LSANQKYPETGMREITSDQSASIRQPHWQPLGGVDVLGRKSV
jgi:hypothetical protein